MWSVLLAFDGIRTRVSSLEMSSFPSVLVSACVEIGEIVHWLLGHRDSALKFMAPHRPVILVKAQAQFRVSRIRTGNSVIPASRLLLTGTFDRLLVSVNWSELLKRGF